MGVQGAPRFVLISSYKRRLELLKATEIGVLDWR